MKRMKTRKAKSSFVCLVAAILLIPAHSVIAQINIGGVTISIPKRAKSPKRDKPETKVESSAELSSDKNEEADNKCFFRPFRFVRVKPITRVYK